MFPRVSTITARNVASGVRFLVLGSNRSQIFDIELYRHGRVRLLFAMLECEMSLQLELCPSFPQHGLLWQTF